MFLIAIAIFTLVFYLSDRDTANKKEKEMDSIRAEINRLKEFFRKR